MTTSAFASMQDLGTDMVILEVGGGNKPKQLFTVHKKLLCEKVPYFHKMFTGTWKEAEENKAVFPEDNVMAFDSLLCWVYTGVLKDFTDEQKSQSIFTTALELYTFFGKICMPQLQENVTDFLLSCGDDVSFPALSTEILPIYEATQAGCGMRKYVSMMAASFIISIPVQPWENPTIAGFEKAMMANSELCLDLVRHFQGSKISGFHGPARRERCEFHEHETRADCYAKPNVYSSWFVPTSTTW